jgi:hypothetical protein
MPCGRLTTPERDQSCLGLAIQARSAGGTLLFLPVECGLQSLFDPTLSDAKHGIDTHGEALGDLGIRPSRPIRIGFQQDMGVSDLGCGRSPFAGQFCQLGAFLVGKTYDVFFVHGTLRLITPSVLRRKHNRLTSKIKADKALGFHRIISLMQQQALAFGIDLKALQLDEIKPDRDLV